MKLLERYALECGLKIGKQYLQEVFYPLSHDGFYITIQSGSGMQSKNYSLFNEVLDVLQPILDKHNIKFVQLGDEKDAPLKHCIHLQGKTSIFQSNYIVSRAMIHIGNDSFLQHRAGHVGVPLVVLFGATDPDNHAAYDYNPKSIFIESHRRGHRPSFSVQEFPASINFIRPEQVINAVLKILTGNDNQFARQSIFLGQKYLQTFLEWVPDENLNPGLFPQLHVTCRLDLVDAQDINVQYLANALANGRKVNLFFNKPVNPNVLRQFKDNILLSNFEILNNDPGEYEYVKMLKRSGVRTRFFSKEKDEKKLADLRLKYLDVTPIENYPFKTKDNFLAESREYLNFPLDYNDSIGKNTWFRSNKFLISKNKIYLSELTWKMDVPVPSFDSNIMQMIDHPDFYNEIDNFYIFRQELAPQ